jgi:hypothetical protein|tara:strand:+ start:950 stop:1279 length:330 start_codon:yes stop_codon:yes gene_type:complete
MKRKTGWLLDIMPQRWQEWINEPDGSVSITTHQDIEPTIEQNKKEYNLYGDKLTSGKMGEWHRVASIPSTIYDQWLKETNGAIKKDNKLLAKYLNDPDNKYFKTAPTKL